MQTLKEAFNKKKIVPYEDILQNKISENSFAVGFHAVLNGTADAIYNDPRMFSHEWLKEEADLYL